MEVEQYIVKTDQELVEMSLKGDSSAFEQLFNRYRASITEIYTKRLDGREGVDDLLQETFIKVFLNLHRYNSDYTFGQWVYTIARNTFIDIVRKQRNEVSLDTISEYNPNIYPSSQTPDPAESMINTQNRELIDHYLAGMSETYRKLVELRFLREYSYEEIAKKLNRPLGTIKTQIHRARAQLCALIIERSDIME